MSKKVKIAVSIISLLVIFLAVSDWLLLKLLEPKNIPEPKSDVPVTYKIGWWAYQKNLSIESLGTKEIYSTLDLFNSRAVIQYTIKGSIKNSPKRKPYIESVYLSERWLHNPRNLKGNSGEIIIIPIVAVKRDDEYRGENIRFNINVQDYLQTGGWGENTYIVKSQDKEAKITLVQYNK